MKLATTLRWLVALAIVAGAASAMAEDLLNSRSGMADAVSLKFLAAPITKQQQDGLFKYYARGAK